jgi:hypothetical protein
LSAPEKKALDLEIFERFLASDASMSLETPSPIKAPISSQRPTPKVPSPTNVPTRAPSPKFPKAGTRPPRPTRPLPPVSPPNSVVIPPPVPKLGGPNTPIRPPRPVSPPNNVVIIPPVPKLVPISNNRGMRRKNRSDVALPVAP